MCHYVLTIDGNVRGVFHTEHEAHSANRSISLEMHRSKAARILLHHIDCECTVDGYGRGAGVITRVGTDSSTTEIYTHFDEETLDRLRKEEAKKNDDAEALRKTVNDQLEKGRAWLAFT